MLRIFEKLIISEKSDFFVSVLNKFRIIFPFCSLTIANIFPDGCQAVTGNDWSFSVVSETYPPLSAQVRLPVFASAILTL